MRVREIMERDVLWIPAAASVSEASRMLREHGVSGAPVGDATGRIIGVLSRTDLAEGWALAEAERRSVFYRDGESEIVAFGGPDPLAAFGEKSVEEVMMSVVFAVQADDDVGNAAALMEAEGIHRVIVLEGGRLAGILSASDIVAAVSRGELVPLS